MKRAGLVSFNDRFFDNCMSRAGFDPGRSVAFSHSKNNCDFFAYQQSHV